MTFLLGIDDQVAVIAGIENLERESLISLMHLVREGRVRLPTGLALSLVCSPNNTWLHNCFSPLVAERLLTPDEFPLLLKQKFHRVSEEPVFVVRNMKDDEAARAPSSNSPVPRNLPQEDPAKTQEKKARRLTFSLSPFLGAKRSSVDSAQRPEEVPSSPVENIAPSRGDITICPDLEKPVPEKIIITSTTTSQILIQQGNFPPRPPPKRNWGLSTSSSLLQSWHGQESRLPGTSICSLSSLMGKSGQFGCLSLL